MTLISKEELLKLQPEKKEGGRGSGMETIQEHISKCMTVRGEQLNAYFTAIMSNPNSENIIVWIHETREPTVFKLALCPK